MKTTKIEIQDITVDELTELIADKLLSKMERFINDSKNKKDDILLTRKETVEYLKISLPTLYSWTKLGILKPLRIGSRVYYNKAQIIDFNKE